jgi:transcription antitermination factor NusG
VSDGAKLSATSRESSLDRIFHGNESEVRSMLPRPLKRSQPGWYAVYTRANHENQVSKQLLLRSVEHFLPSYDSVRCWKDRKVRLQLPLFPGYVFVRIPLFDQMHVLQVPGVVRLVGFNAGPTELPEEEIDAMRNGLRGGVCAQPHPYLVVGRRVRVVCGPLAGLKGIVLKKKNSTRVVITLEVIMRSVAVEVDPADLQPIQ